MRLYNICEQMFVFLIWGYEMSRPLTFENHDAYLMYNYSTKRTPDLKVHGEVSVKYAMYLYYKTFPVSVLIASL